MTGSPPPFLAWYPGQPNGRTLQQCVSVELRDSNLFVYDDSCDNRHCHICSFSQITHYRLRGLCPAAAQIVDQFYMVIGRGDFYWRGYSKTRIDRWEC